MSIPFNSAGGVRLLGRATRSYLLVLRTSAAKLFPDFLRDFSCPYVEEYCDFPRKLLSLSSIMHHHGRTLPFCLIEHHPDASSLFQLQGVSKQQNYPLYVHSLGHFSSRVQCETERGGERRREPKGAPPLWTEIKFQRSILTSYTLMLVSLQRVNLNPDLLFMCLPRPHYFF